MHFKFQSTTLFHARGFESRQRRRMMKSLNHDVEKTLYRFIVGIVAGFFIGTKLMPTLTSHQLCIRNAGFGLPWNGVLKQEDVPTKRASSDQKSIYIGMMSMENKMETRVRAALNTWAKHPNVKVEIFANNNGTFNKELRYTSSYLENGIRVIQLPGVTDYVYPPQKKSFSMVKFMHDMYLDRYDWFIRLDDDAYVHTEKLQALLSRINSTKSFYLGHAGFGRGNEDFIENGENYCMGGPGMVFSNGLMRKLAPKLKNCLRNLLTTHEDIELGRCIRLVTGVKCAMSWELPKIFFQNYQHGTYAHNIETIASEDLESGVIFHANKEPQHQHNFHAMALKHKVRNLISKVVRLEKELRRNFAPEEDMLNLAANSYSQFRWNSIIRSQRFVPNERKLNRRMHVTVKDVLIDNTNKYVKRLKKENIDNVRHLKGVALTSSYDIVNPLFSVDVISQIDCSYSSPLRAASMPQQRKKKTLHIHQRRYFPHSIQFFTEPNEIDPSILNAKAQIDYYENQQRLKTATFSGNKVAVNFLTALSGRPDNFLRFLNNIEGTFYKQGENINLIVVYFPQEVVTTVKNQERKEEIIEANSLNIFSKESKNKASEDVSFISNHMELLQQKYPKSRIKLVMLKAGTEFSRGVGLQVASQQVKNNDEILYFCDVDLAFAPDLLTRIRRNTIRGKRIYYPVVLSQYDPDVVYVERSKPPTHFSFEELDGFWIYFGYGMLAIYKSDFDKTNGFDTKIRGWGLEDIHLADSLLGTSLDVFKSTEPAQVHIYHDKFCDRRISTKQYTDCINTRASNYGPQTLLYYLYQAPIVESRKHYNKQKY